MIDTERRLSVRQDDIRVSPLIEVFEGPRRRFYSNPRGPGKGSPGDSATWGYRAARSRQLMEEISRLYWDKVRERQG
jgi:hypothetical protein